jgi:hypothetical protein
MPESKYKVKAKPKKGAPLSAAQKQAVESGTFERKRETVGSIIKRKNSLGLGYSRSTKPSKGSVSPRVVGGAGYCPKGTKNCKTAYGKYSK